MPFCDQCGGKSEKDQKFCGVCGYVMTPENSTVKVSNDLKSANLTDSDSYKEVKNSSKTQPTNQSGYLPLQEQSHTSSQKDQVQKYVGKIPQRNYFKYLGASFGLVIIGLLMILSFIISLFTGSESVGFLFAPFLAPWVIFGGVFVLYYYYYANFNDFRNLHYKTHDLMTTPKPQDPGLMLILTIVFSPVALYYKYQQLHDHLFIIHGFDKNTGITGLKYILVVFSPLILLIVNLTLLFGNSSIIFITGTVILLWFGLIPFIVIYFEYSWQKRLNEHIVFHDA